jgi:hypothetical protein
MAEAEAAAAVAGKKRIDFEDLRKTMLWRTGTLVTRLLMLQRS